MYYRLSLPTVWCKLYGGTLRKAAASFYLMGTAQHTYNEHATSTRALTGAPPHYPALSVQRGVFRPTSNITENRGANTSKTQQRQSYTKSPCDHNNLIRTTRRRSTYATEQEQPRGARLVPDVLSTLLGSATYSYAAATGRRRTTRNPLNRVGRVGCSNVFRE